MIHHPPNACSAARPGTATASAASFRCARRRQPAVIGTPSGHGSRGGRRSDVRVATGDGVSLIAHDYPATTAGATIVFLHGFCLSSISWAHQIAYLRGCYGTSARIISYDHRGHGNSDSAPMNTLHIDQLADDLARVLTALGVGGPVVFVGHSMGAMVALAYLARDKAGQPVEPAGLVLVATTAGKLAERGLGRLLATPVTPALYGLVEHTPNRALKTLAGPVCALLGRWAGHGPAERATLSAVAAAALARTPLSTAIGFLPSLRDFDQTGILGSIRARTVVVSGGADLLTPPVHAHELAVGIPGAAHIHLPAAGHMLPQQAPHVIGAAIEHVMPAHQAATGAAGRGGNHLTAAAAGHAVTNGVL